MSENLIYYKYSAYLKTKYGQKVYKLPVNLPVTCPNRLDGQGCTFCAEIGTGFEALSSETSVSEQLRITKEKISVKYNASKFIAYFQNYTNTFLPVAQFQHYMEEAAHTPQVVELAISTRPDCISRPYLDVLKKIEEDFQISITIELGLQTANYHTLDTINRGHGLAEFIDAVKMAKEYGFEVCAHVILNLPGDTQRDALETSKIISALCIDLVKVHSLYIAKNTILCDAFENGTITLCSKEEYFERVCIFLEHLNPEIAVERLFARIPQEDSVFCNWETSWWKLQDELLAFMDEKQSFQGKNFHYLGGAALSKL